MTERAKENLNEGDRESRELGGWTLSESPAAQSKEPIIETSSILCHLKSITHDLLQVARNPRMQTLSIVNCPRSTAGKTLWRRRCWQSDEGDPEERRPNLSNLSAPLSSPLGLGPRSFIRGNGFHQAIINRLRTWMKRGDWSSVATAPSTDNNCPRGPKSLASFLFFDLIMCVCLRGKQ